MPSSEESPGEPSSRMLNSMCGSRLPSLGDSGDILRAHATSVCIGERARREQRRTSKRAQQEEITCKSCEQVVCEEGTHEGDPRNGVGSKKCVFLANIPRGHAGCK
eukprot:5368353-Prymnesium_polylepis.1